MFLKYKVDIPVVPGKLVRKNRGGHTYIEYEYDRIYDPLYRNDGGEDTKSGGRYFEEGPQIETSP